MVPVGLVKAHTRPSYRRNRKQLQRRSDAQCTPPQSYCRLLARSARLSCRHRRRRRLLINGCWWLLAWQRASYITSRPFITLQSVVCWCFAQRWRQVNSSIRTSRIASLVPGSIISRRCYAHANPIDGPEALRFRVVRPSVSARAAALIDRFAVDSSSLCDDNTLTYFAIVRIGPPMRAVHNSDSKNKQKP